MTYRELLMMDVNEILRRRAAGQSVRQIARDAGPDRKTVRRYVAAADAAALPVDRPPTEEEVHQVAQRVQARAGGETSREWIEIAQHRERITSWLGEKRPLRLRKVHILLVRDHGLRASYDTLRRFVRKELGWNKKKPTVRLADTEPGQVAQVDFGQMGLLNDGQGKLRRFYALVVTLAFSRYQFVWVTFDQTTEAVCAGLDAAWAFFGAMVHVIVPDNMSAMVSKADSLAPVFVPAFADYVQTRALFVDPARVRSPKDKARVENQVAYVRENCFDGETLGDLAAARTHAETWCRETAGARIHGTTCQVPREVFLEQEIMAMKPAPREPFDVPHWTDAKVHPDHHVQVLRSLYSVPTRYLGTTVRVRADRTQVKVYAGTEVIKVHPRMAPGKRSTDPNDYPVGQATTASRDVATLVASAKQAGEHVGRYAERLLDVPLPWSRMRLVYALLRLCKKYGDGRVEAVCQSALAFEVVDVPRITRMLAAAQPPKQPTRPEQRVVPLPAPRFARSAEHFATRPSRKESE